MTPQRFDELVSQGYNRIPLMREVLADLDTPLSAYLKLASGPYSYLFESVHGGQKWGRYSIIGLPTRTIVRVSGQEITVEREGEILERSHSLDPLTWIESFHNRYRVPEIQGVLRFTGGLVGYFGYDTVRYVEPRLGHCPHVDPLGCPDMFLMVSDE